MIGPYKFLDYYDFADADIFFGRDLEIEKLLSDVVSTRLVLLFAKTGSGKTSLINAGVRPRLQALDYETFYVRVERDPTDSAIATLKNENVLPADSEGFQLDAILKQIVETRKKPIVLFFDQFEEFFIYVSDEKARTEFIITIARIYRDRESGVHVVFSFREEFFVEMEAFRDEIPSIFHNESNLRLRWFTREQAKDAIVKPAKHFGVEVEEEFVNEVLNDLDTERGIEPARLQVVCDTLWSEKENRMLTKQYRTLGRAQRIIEHRLEQDIDDHMNDNQLRLFEKLLPALRTEVALKAGPAPMRGRVFEELLKPYKYGRTVEDLIRILEIDEPTLRELIRQLKDLRLVKEVKRFDDIYIEWSSDYLADLTDFLSMRVRAILLRRLLRYAMGKAASTSSEIERRKRDRTQPSVPLDEVELEGLYMPRDTFIEISRDAGLLEELRKEEVNFLFEAALQHGFYVDYWFGRAQSIGEANGWKIIEQKITDENARFEQAENALRLLGEIGNAQAVKVLESAQGQEALAPIAIQMLSNIGTADAFAILEKELLDDQLGDLVIDSLSQLKSSKAVQLIGSALEDAARQRHAEQALVRLSRSKGHPFSAEAERILLKWKRQAERGPELRGDRDLSPPPAESLKEIDWEILLRRIRDGNCIPIVGPDVSAKYYHSFESTAKQWATRERYPFQDDRNLASVAEFVEMKYDRPYLTERLSEEFQQVEPPSVFDPEDSLTLLADLPVRVYLSTTYDDLLVRALKARNKDPKVAICKWNESLRGKHPFDSELEFRPSVANPLVFYLYGELSVPESVVLTTGDYLDFFQNLSADRDLIPRQVQRSIFESSILFLGFPFFDLGTRILFEVMARSPLSRNRANYAIVRSSAEDLSEVQETRVQTFMAQYLARQYTKVFHGTIDKFSSELRARWQSSGS